MIGVPPYYRYIVKLAWHSSEPKDVTSVLMCVFSRDCKFQRVNNASGDRWPYFIWAGDDPKLYYKPETDTVRSNQAPVVYLGPKQESPRRHDEILRQGGCQHVW